MFSRFFIQRPIFATVLAVIIVLAGVMAGISLPIAQYPDITPPTVMVSCSYPGADAKTVAQTVAAPIEQQINGVEGMMYMSSESSDGSYSLTVTFKNGTDIDQAAVDIQNRISQVDSQLPESVIQQGVSIMKESSNNILFIALEAENGSPYDALYLTNYAQIHLVEPLSRVDGVGGVGAFGGGEYDMRIWLDPQKLNLRNITPAEVADAISQQNVNVSAGTVGETPGAHGASFEYSLSATGSLSSPEEFGNIILRKSNNGLLRLKDVATVELGSTSYSEVARVNGQQTALMGISQRPGANALEVADAALAELDRQSKYFPEGVSYRVVLNSTDYVRESIDEVVLTFIETSVIVMIVIMLFLQNWRAVIIPMLTIPVSLIGTLAVMKLMGFSLNTLTLFGLVLAIAIVVDDAIVVVEDCARLVSQGKLNRVQAAEKAMTELTGPVVGEVLVLLSVFIPTAFISGITGKLYKQFALTIAVSTAISGFNALTLTPALCGLFLNPKSPHPNIIFRIFNKGYNAVATAYEKTISLMLGHAKTWLLIFIAIVGVSLYFFVKFPSEYLPEEDMGYCMASVQLPTGASLERTENVVNKLSAEIRKQIPAVKYVMSVSGVSMMGGGSGSNGGSLFIILKPWKERKDWGVDKVVAKIDEIAATTQQEAIVFAANPPSIPGLGSTSGLTLQLLDINSYGPTEIAKAVDDLKTALMKTGMFSDINSTYQAGVPQYSITVDRDKAATYGLDIDQIFSTISAFTGSAYAGDFVDFGRTYQITLRASGDARANIEDLSEITVRNASGDMVPFKVFATLTPVLGESSVARYNMYTTASLTAMHEKGVSSSTAIKEIESTISKTLGSNFSYAWSGVAYQETNSSTTISFVFIFAIIMTILVLAAQYESWTDPLAVVLAMPIAVLGCLLGVIFMRQAVGIYTQIGLILLLGMAAKNAILIVEYAMDFRKTGVDITKAAHDAGVIRFRPIMMTALAFIFGVMPMLFASGAGAGSRKEIGAAIVFGMTINAIFGTLFVPTFWKVMQTFNEKYLSKLFRLPAKSKNAGANTDTAADKQLPPSI